MAKKTRNYPPSRLKYREKNPYITFNVPVEIKKKIENLCKETGISKAQLIKNFFMDMTNTFDDIKQSHATEINAIKQTHANEIETTRKNSYQKGAMEKENELKAKFDKEIDDRLKNEKIKIKSNADFEAQKKYEIWYYCVVCNQKITLQPNSDEHKSMIKSMKEIGWGHAVCHNKKPAYRGSY